jgi:hypothetical protein
VHTKFLKISLNLGVKVRKVMSLFLTKHHAMKKLGEWRYSTTHSLTSALDGGEWSVSRSTTLPPGKEPPVPLGQEGGWSPEKFWTIKIPSSRRNSNPDHSIVQPVASRYTDRAIPDPKFEGQKHKYRYVKISLNYVICCITAILFTYRQFYVI